MGTGVDGVCQVLSPGSCCGVGGGREPGRVVGIEVAKDEGGVGVGEEGLEIRGVVCGAGAVWREVDVKDVGRGIIDGGLDSIYFKDIVGEVGCVYGDIGNGVVDKEGYTTPLSTACAVFPEDGIAREVGGFEF